MTNTARAWLLGLGLVILSAACTSAQGGNPGTGGSNATGTGGNGTGGSGPTCNSTQTLCGSACVDTATDSSNCGVCGNPCSGGQTCQGSTCKCPSGMLSCGGSCVASDATNCGTCGHACTTGQVCSGNSCGSTCSGSQMLCGTSCVDTTSSAANCGTCGHACTATQHCASSACVDNVTTGTGGSTGTGGNGTGGSTGTGGMAGAKGTGGAATGGSTGTGGTSTGGATGTGGTAVTMKVITSAPNAYWMTATATTSTGTATVTVNDTSPAQKWDGFGGAFNEIGWNVLTTTAMQTQAMTMLFSSTDGANFAWGRIPMGASDYATSRYTCDDTGTDVTPSSSNRPPADTSMAMFSLTRDGQKLIPYIKAAQAVNPNLRFWSSPWTPPVWLKSGYNSDSGTKKPSYFDGGSIISGNSSYLTAYASYYSKFVMGYKAQGINIEVVSPQNEPGYQQNYPSCIWDSATYVSFIKELGKAMAPLNVKVMLGTMSNNGDTSAGVARHDTDLATAVLNDSTAAGYLSVAGAQWGVLDAVISGTKFGNLPIWATEHKCGNYPWNPSGYPAYNSSKAPNDQAYGVESWGYISKAIRNGKVSAYNAWNMVLDSSGLGIDTTRDWKQDALLVASGSTVTATPAYYVFRHLSQYVQPGATVVGTSGGDAVAFKNTDGSVVVAMYNSGSATTYVVSIKGQKLSFAMPGTGWATVVVP
jgi:glucosylceramidase